MNRKWLSVSAALCVSMMIANAQTSRAQLQPLQPADPEWLTEMYQQGWQKVEEGVLQRNEGGAAETFTYGDAGLRWRVQGWEEELAALEGIHQNHPSPELAQGIDRLQEQIDEANGRLSSGDIGEPFSDDAMNNCDIAFGYHAYATPLSGNSAPGVWASANAYFRNNCHFTGQPYAKVTLQASSGSQNAFKFLEDVKPFSTWVEAAAQWSLGGSSGCFSEGFASVVSYDLNINYSVTQQNYSCPQKLTVTVYGQSNVYTNYHSTPCADITWTASSSGGQAPLSSTYDWYINNVYQSSGSSLTQQYCYTSATLNVKAVGRDAANQTAEGLFTTYVSYEAEPYDPCGYGGCCGGGYDPRYDLYRPYEICY